MATSFIFNIALQASGMLCCVYKTYLQLLCLNDLDSVLEPPGSECSLSLCVV